MSQLKAIVDKLLTMASSAYVPRGYISEMLLPQVNVRQKTGKLGKYGTNHLRIENTIAGGRGKYRFVEAVTRETESYAVDSHGLEGQVTEDDYANVEEPFDAENDESLFLTVLLWLQKEKALADALTDTATITQNTTLSGTSQFDDYLNSDPIDAFNTAQNTILDACGFMPDTVSMDVKVFNYLKKHPQLLDSLGYKDNRPGGLKVNELAEAIGVRRLLLAETRYESAKEGATSSLQPVWGKHIVFSVSPESPELRQKSLGYRVQLSGRPPRRVFKYNINNPPNSTGILVDDSYDQLLSDVSCAYLIKDAIS